MYKAIINNKAFEVIPEESGYRVNGQQVSWDLSAIGDRYFHILLNNTGYRAEIIQADAETKSFVILVNGRSYRVELKDQYDLLLEKMGMNNTSAGKMNAVKAPMPGLIIDLKVKDGDEVKQGDALLILEAMKMENILKSPGDGKVKSVKIKKGQSVEKNQVLIEF